MMKWLDRLIRIALLILMFFLGNVVGSCIMDARARQEQELQKLNRQREESLRRIEDSIERMSKRLDAILEVRR